jgi:hypothetical protein
MSITLASTWNPRGELARFRKHLPDLREIYSGIRIVLPPEASGDPLVVETVREMGFEVSSDTEAPSPVELLAAFAPDWSWGRYQALRLALQTPAAHIHYADFDRLLRWVETRPEEWRAAVAGIQGCDCLITGRSPEAYLTHPQALVQTEAISNQVVSHLTGRGKDFSAGSKGFSRRAAEFLLANSSPGRALGTDGEWPVLLHRAGFAIESMTVEGLDWESADRYQDRAAGVHDQRRAAQAYDANPANWERRVQVAMEIVQAALEANERCLTRT